MLEPTLTSQLLGFPAPLEVWVGSYKKSMIGKAQIGTAQFPAPLEAWVGSYLWNDNSVIASDRVFPAPLEGWWVPTFNNGIYSRKPYKFPAPLEDWGVSY